MSRVPETGSVVRKLVAPLVAITLVVAGCGSGSGARHEEPNTNAVPVAPPQWRCVGLWNRGMQSQSPEGVLAMRSSKFVNIGFAPSNACVITVVNGDAFQSGYQFTEQAGGRFTLTWAGPASELPAMVWNARTDNYSLSLSS